MKDSAFNKAICETLLNQKYFNGIGNYLRAEILYRLKIPPFTKARDVLGMVINKMAKTTNIIHKRLNAHLVTIFEVFHAKKSAKFDINSNLVLIANYESILLQI